MGASTSSSAGWDSKISFALLLKPLIYSSLRGTSFPGLEVRTASSLLMMLSTSMEIVFSYFICCKYYEGITFESEGGFGFFEGRAGSVKMVSGGLHSGRPESIGAQLKRLRNRYRGIG